MIVTNAELHRVSGWEEQTADLIRDMWSSNGVCYFPYYPMTTVTYWSTEAPRLWSEGAVSSVFWLDENGGITATASLVKKKDYWELGRFNSRETNPKGTMLKLVQHLLSDPRLEGQRILCETTQAHTSSQYIAHAVGLRFAGYGYLKTVGICHWDILYFDNAPLKDFVSCHPLHVNNVFGVDRDATPEEVERLRNLPEISTEKYSGYPPQKFHMFEPLVPNLLSIIRMNAEEVSCI